MSHLSTIIQRIERTIEAEDDPMDDPLMEQHIRNLKEYPRLWDDATSEEMKRREELLEGRPWIVETVYVVECVAEDCDWFVEVGNREDAAETGQGHYFGNGEDHPTVWEKEVIEWCHSVHWTIAANGWSTTRRLARPVLENGGVQNILISCIPVTDE